MKGNQLLLEVRNLRTYFFVDKVVIEAVDDVSFSVSEGDTLGIVGESGCGKSVTCLSIIRLIQNPGRVVGGEILLEGDNLLKKTNREMRRIRGSRISMIFQEPMTSLNPVFTVGDQIMEAIILHHKLGRREARRKTIEMLKTVGLASPERRIDEYPHQMSGGMKQRIMIAMALSCNSKLLIADEPTTALDVTIQSQILNLIKRLQEELGMAVILITHNLGVVAEVVNKVIVMYAGKIVEVAGTQTLFQNPRHPYTIGLLDSIPKLNEDRDRLRVIEGTVPDLFNIPTGCRFHPRCPYVKDICMKTEPELVEVGPGHQVRCVKYEMAYGQ